MSCSTSILIRYSGVSELVSNTPSTKKEFKGELSARKSIERKRGTTLSSTVSFLSFLCTFILTISSLLEMSELR